MTSKEASILKDRHANETAKIYSNGSAHKGKVGAVMVLICSGQPTKMLHYHLGPDTKHMVHKCNRLLEVVADCTNVSSGTSHDRIRFAVLYWLIDVSTDDYFLLALKAVFDMMLLYDWVVSIPTT